MNAGDVAKVPIVVSSKHELIIDSLVSDMVSLSKEDWNAFEISWDFKKHPLV